MSSSVDDPTLELQAMSQTATQENANTVSISDAGPSRKKISIEIPAEAVMAKISESIDGLASEASLPGFRKGHAPRNLVEKRFGTAVRDEAKGQLIGEAYSKAIEDNNLKVLGEPSGETLAGLELKDNEPFAFEVEVEILPEFDLPELEGLDVKKPVLEVSDGVVDAEVEKLKLSEGSLESHDDSKAGDYLTGHAIMTGAEDKEFYNIPGAVVQVPDSKKDGGMILGILVGDLGKQLGLPKAGDDVVVKAKGPENHETEEVRNADLTITFKVERADRIVPVEIGQILSKFGMEEESQLKEAIQGRMEQRAAVEQQTAMRQQVAKHLLDNVEMDLPERLTAQQAARTLEQRRLELMYRGLEAQQIEEHMGELRAASAAVAQRELKLFFVLNKIADTMEIKVEEPEINGRIAQLAIEGGRRPEQLRQELIQNNQVGNIYQQVRDHKAMDAILAKANITEMPAEEFNKLMKAEDAD